MPESAALKLVMLQKNISGTIYEPTRVHHCGESNPVVLEFHHRHGKDKAVTEMAAAGYPIYRIQAEIDKCEVLCANCHRILTSKERGWFRSSK
jgi:hypothetical protein